MWQKVWIIIFISSQIIRNSALANAQNDDEYKINFEKFTIVMGADDKPKKTIDDDMALGILAKGEDSAEIRRRLLKNYNKNLRPPDYGSDKNDNSTKVNVNIFIENFGFINVQDMTYNIEIILCQRWNDKRLKHNETKYLVFTDIKNKLWTPDLFFRNSRSVDTKPISFVWVYPNGNILYSQRMSLTLACIMRLEEFPMDSQQCFIEIGSYGYTTDELEFFWIEDVKSKHKIELSERIFLNEFHKPIIETGSCQSVTSTGNFTCLIGKLILVRNFNFYLLYTYLPSALIIVICWLSFFVNYTVIAGRVSLCLFSLLSLLTQSASVITSLPPVSYVKAIDIWLFYCLALVIIALTEFSLINFYCVSKVGANPIIIPPEEKNKENEETMNSDNLCVDMDLMNSDKKEADLKLPTPVYNGNEQIGHDVDKIFRVIFPVAFVGFNFAYWSYYYANESAALVHND